MCTILMFRRCANLFTNIASRNLCYKGLKKSVNTSSEKTDYDSYSKVYDNERGTGGSDVICAFLQFYTGIKLKDMKVLDAGCGTGTITKALIEYGVGNVSLVDASKDMLEVAKGKLADEIQSGTVSSIIHHYIPAIPFPDASFDAVMFNFFFHMEGTRDDSEHVRTLKEAQRVLKPNGVVLISSVVKSTAKNMWASKLDRALEERYASKLPALDWYDQMFYETGLACIQTVAINGSDEFPNYLRNPSSFINNNYLNFINATQGERQKVNQAIEDLKQKGELQQWIAEHDTTTGLATVFVCRANADCSSHEG